ncbi:MAG: cell wall-active antibiotics response protein [Mariniphaga sp.]|nr:cell wall-active antibiotics response protein [Mariniphaga sp.]
MRTFVEKRIMLGILLLLAGIFLMLHFYDLLPWVLPVWVFSWKMLLVVLGIFFIITEKKKSTGIILFLIGSIFIAGEIFDMRFWEVVRFVIPLVLIVAGVSILMRKQVFKPKEFNIPEGADIHDFINETNIFGGGEKKYNSQNFKGGQMTAIFGGSEIDLRHAKLAPGVNAIDLLCIFGGTSIRVPEDWVVKVDVTAIFGGFSDERFLDKKTVFDNPEKVLYIKGLVLFGGGEIK